MTLANKAKNATGWSLLDKFINQGGYFVVLIYLANILDPKDFGIIGMLSVFLIISDVNKYIINV